MARYTYVHKMLIEETRILVVEAESEDEAEHKMDYSDPSDWEVDELRTKDEDVWLESVEEEPS